MAHSGMPRPAALVLSKETLLRTLLRVDGDADSSRRALAMESEFRSRIEDHLARLPTADARFAKFNTSPFVLMFYALQHRCTRIREIEQAILPAKVFSSMETSAGRMVESVVLPRYGWEFSPSEMQSANSAIDGKKIAGDTLCLATLKSGPRCLNDEMSENFADAVLNNCVTWARSERKSRLDFTYGVLYGTPRQSNKKDWHILRNLVDKLPPRSVRERPDGRWHCRFEKQGVDVTATVRIGLDLWSYIAGHDLAVMEIWTALLRACVRPSEGPARECTYAISDLAEIVSLSACPDSFNPGILQRSQLEWLLFLARHFCDELVPGDLAALSSSARPKRQDRRPERRD